IVTFVTPIVFQDTGIDYELTTTDNLNNTLVTTGTLFVNTYEHDIANFKKLSTINTENFSSEDYEVFNFSFDAIETAETYTDTLCYPTPTDCTTEEGYFKSEMQGGMWGDFNGDNHEDFVATWQVFPHTLERETDPYQTISNIEIYLNNGEGRLIRDRNIYLEGEPPAGHMLYRVVVDDFNQDDIDDVFAVNQGLTKRVDGKYVNTLSPHVLLLSTPEGKLRNASLDIGGNENVTSGGHTASSGDVNGDGYPDLFA
ncbi:uncharacterized protein METZ01_LOCUS451798, partial [marine metagenome]